MGQAEKVLNTIKRCWGNFDCLIDDCWQATGEFSVIRCFFGVSRQGTKWFYLTILIGSVIKNRDLIRFAFDRYKGLEKHFGNKKLEVLFAELEKLDTHDWYISLPFHQQRFISSLSELLKEPIVWNKLDQVDERAHSFARSLLLLLLVSATNFEKVKHILIEHSNEINSFFGVYGAVRLIEQLRNDPGYLTYFDNISEIVVEYIGSDEHLELSAKDSIMETFLNALRSADYFAKEYAELKERIDVKTIPAEGYKRLISKEFSLVVTLADLHIGEHVQVVGFTYDLDVFKNRFAEYSSVVLQMVEDLNPPEIVVMSLGDLISGLIHEELLRAPLNVAEWTMIAVETLAIFLEELLRHSKADIRFIGIYGNHGRMQRRVQFKARSENFDYLIYKMLEFHFQGNSRLHFEIPIDPYHYTTIQGYNFVLAHGDDVRAWMNFPFYGLTRQAAKLKLLKQSEPPDYFVLGHFHTSNMFDHFYGEVFNVGSMKGPDEYSIARVPVLSRPSQLIFIVEKGRGVTIRWPYYFDY